MKKLFLPILLLLSGHVLAQQQEELGELCMSPRANVVTYDNENAIEHLSYTGSSYLISLADDWTVSSDQGHHVLSANYEFPRDWRNYRLYFRMMAPSGYGLWLGEKLVGLSHDCYAVTEFDITSLVRFGKSMPLTVRYAGNDDGSLLDPFQAKESANQMPQCILMLKPLLNVQDYTVSADYNPADQSGSYSVEADIFNAKAKGKSYLEVEIWDYKGHQVDKLGKWCFFDKRTETTQTITSLITKVQPWNSEVPRLYTAVIRLFDEKMELVDLVGTRFGFRSLEVGNTLLLNGEAVKLKGVTLKTDSKLYSSDDIKRLRTQLVQMKCNNVNAIRFVGGNPQSPLLELCDELGFYVVCDANIFPMSNMGHAVATDNEYSDLFVNRVRTLYGQYKNHTSIIAWSLGTSEDNGVCMQAAYKALKRLDQRRPVIYAGAQYADNTDVIVPLNCNADLLSQYLAKAPSRPLLMLTYGCSTGNSLGGLQPIWQKVYDNRTIQGGFLNLVDGWQEIYSSPMLGELKQLYRPFDIAMTSNSVDAAEFDVTNLCDFRPLSDFSLDYIIYTNYKPNIVAGDVALSLRSGETKGVKLKVPQVELASDEELFILFTLRQRNNTISVPKNTVLYTRQFSLPARPSRPQPFVSKGNPLKIEKDTLHRVNIYNDVISVTFDDSLGLITSMAYKGTQMITQPLRLNFMRVPSNNDCIDPNGVKQWQNYLAMDCEVVATNCRPLEAGAVGIDAMFRYSSAKSEGLFDARQAIVVYPSGDIMVNSDVTLSEQVKSVAKIGIQMGLNKALDTVEWMGRNVESYSDRRSFGLIAHQSQPASSLFHRYRGIQHAGNRAEVRWTAIRNGQVGLYMDLLDTLCNFSIYPYDDMKLFGARGELGWNEVEEQNFWTVNIDSRVAGVGSTLGGVNIEESSLLKVHKSMFTLHLRPYDCETDNASVFRRIVYPKVESSIIEMPVIRKNRERFDAPMQITITCPTPKVDIRYTIDGSIPNEKSLLYTKPFTVSNSVIVKARAFKKGDSPSFIATQHYTFDYVTSCSFAHKPNTPYNKNASKALFDGEYGDVNDLSRGWLGFSGHDVQVDLELGKSINIQQVKLRFGHVPDAWVFAPAAVTVQVSEDGKQFSDPVAATITYNAADESMNTTQLQIVNIPVEKKNVRFVRVTATPISRIPQWHRAKGLKPWIMMDEIEIEETIGDFYKSPRRGETTNNTVQAEGAVP